MPLMSTVVPTCHIRELLETFEYTHHEVAQQLGVPLAEVKRVATTVRNIFPDMTKKPQRCSQCGTKVYMPCLACSLRNLTAR